jgi:peptide subunit release factor 1 (eRF1)
MADAIPVSQQPLSQRMETLAALEPSPFPVISLYLSLAGNQNGRDDYQQFIRKVFSERAKALPGKSPERESFETDVKRIQEYLEDKANTVGQALAIFASSGSDLFEVVSLEAPIGQHWLFVGSVPHLYPLAQLVENYPRYAAVMLDTNKARIFVFGVARTEREEKVVGAKTRRTSKGGWSQARYQRRADNFHTHHIKEVVDTLDRIVREEGIEQIVVAGAEVAVPLLREQLPKHLADKIVDVIGMPGNGDDNFLETTMMTLREKDAETDIERVQELMDAWHSGGLGVAGPEATLSAFQMGQVEELIITGSPETLKPVQTLPDDAAPGTVQVDSSASNSIDERRLKLSDELVTRAHQTAARIRFIEDASLLAGVGGVGALLRFRI